MGNLKFKRELWKGAFFNGLICPGTFGEITELEAPDSTIINGMLLEGPTRKPTKKLVKFEPIALIRTREVLKPADWHSGVNKEYYIENIVIGVEAGNPDKLDLEIELLIAYKYIQKQYVIVSSVTATHALAIALEDYGFKKA